MEGERNLSDAYKADMSTWRKNQADFSKKFDGSGHLGTYGWQKNDDDPNLTRHMAGKND
jgi:hypothetical protein